MTRPPLLPTLGALLAIFALIQLVPYRIENPPLGQATAWDSTRTEELARRACFDCHSNESKTPWYGQIAPMAWVLRDHVDEGRSFLNFSERNRDQEEAHEAAEEVREGEMPPLYYRIMHAEARLNDAELFDLAAGLDATLGEAKQGAGGRGHRRRDRGEAEEHERGEDGDD